MDFPVVALILRHRKGPDKIADVSDPVPCEEELALQCAVPKERRGVVEHREVDRSYLVEIGDEPEADFESLLRIQCGVKEDGNVPVRIGTDGTTRHP